MKVGIWVAVIVTIILELKNMRSGVINQCTDSHTIYT